MLNKDFDFKVYTFYLIGIVISCNNETDSPKMHVANQGNILSM